MAQFGEILSELRKDREMLQKDLAARMHVSEGTISNYENGAHFPDIPKLIELAHIFNVTTDYLLGLCASNTSPDVLDQPLLGEKTAGLVINEISSLNQDRKVALSIILSDMILNRQIQVLNSERKFRKTSK